MAPSAALQSRIKVFETLEAETNTQQSLKNGVRPLTISRTPGPKVAEYRHGQNILDSDPTSPTVDTLFAITPIQPVPGPSQPPSPAFLGRKSSLIDFSELSSPRLKPLTSNGTGSTTSSTSTSDSMQRAPQLSRVPSHLPSLPPRKLSSVSLKTTPTIISPLPRRLASSPISTSTKPIAPGTSLLPPSDIHTYPPTSAATSPRLGESPELHSRHVPSSSTSSFHSVSLSSDSGGETRNSLDGSYEAVSSTAATSPTTHEWKGNTLPILKSTRQRPIPNSSIMNNPPPFSRRPAPPPPRKDTKLQVSRPAPGLHNRPVPLPPNVRKRYDELFERNMPHRGRESGWRGFTVDLLANDEKPDTGDEALSANALDGSIIKQIWRCSKLPRARLREIWNDCDPDCLGSLDKDSFAKGMWQIDEELRRIQNQPRSSLLNTVPLSYAPRAPPPSRKPKFLR